MRGRRPIGPYLPGSASSRVSEANPNALWDKRNLLGTTALRELCLRPGECKLRIASLRAHTLAVVLEFGELARDLLEFASGHGGEQVLGALI